MADYKVLAGLSYAGKRAEVGAVVSDIPAKSVAWLLEQGLIEPVESKSTKHREPVSEEQGDE